MSKATIHRVGIIMNGVTGRMGTNQHLMRSIHAIRQQGGIALNEQEVIMPDPILVGRNPIKLEKRAQMAGLNKWTTNLDEALSDNSYSVYFDAQSTDRRVEDVKKAIAAGKHIYCEKPVALTTKEAYDLHVLAEEAGVKHGVVQDKLWLPGLVKLQMLRDSGFFGEILSVRGEFGYWVFEGDVIKPQRPSWNYRAEDGGGIIFDMMCHWRYVIDNLFGNVKSLSCLAQTHIEKRWDEHNQPYTCTADDAAYATLELENGVIAHFNSSWCVRPRRDDLLTIQVDGTKGSAVAGLQECWTQSYGSTPMHSWNPDIPNPLDFYAGWSKVPHHGTYENAFKAQWVSFLKYVVADAPYRFDLMEGAKGVQLAEIALASSEARAWLDVPSVVDTYS